MKFGVVIVTYNRLGLLQECLEYVWNQSIPFESIVVVENGSTDGTREYLKTCEQKCHVIYEEKNGGGAKGFKDGVENIIKNSLCDWVLLIDDDAIIDVSYIEAIQTAIEECPNCLAFSGVVTTDGVIDISHRTRLKNTEEKFLTIPVPANEYSEKQFLYDISSFCGLVVNADLVRKIGLPLEEYFIWCDDTEYSLRIRKHSQIVNVNNALLNHKTKKALDNPEVCWKSFYGVRNLADTICRHGTKAQYLNYVKNIKFAMIKNLLRWVVMRDRKYRYYYNVYRDALRNQRENRFGFNDGYSAQAEKNILNCK